MPQSKSSLETLSDCAYKFGQVYLLGKRGAPTKAAQAGTHVHKRLEDWRNTGKEIDQEEEWEGYKIGKIAHVMCETIPPYGTPDIETEKDETFEIEGYEFRTIKDWTAPDILGDYKTTSRINADHVLTEETLRTDLQATLSARHLDRDLTLWWTYGQSQGKPKAKTVKLRVLKQETRDQFHQIVEPLTVRALEILSKNDPESLPRNKNACFKYGKCHLFNSCWVVPGQPMRFYMSGSGLLDKLNALKNGPAPEPPSINPPIVMTGTPPEPEPEHVKKPRGRPKKDPVTEALKTEAPAPDKTKPIRTLYIGCMPLSQDPKLLQAHVLMSKAAETVTSDMQVPHVKLVEFNKGGACLAAQLRADILEMEPGFDLVLMLTPEGRDVQQELTSLAQHVVVAF